MEKKVELVEISLYEFKKKIYNEYTNIFSEKERKSYNSIAINVKRGVTHLIKIVVDKKDVGFYIVNILPNNRYLYIDCFAIFKKYQNKGYGTKSMQKLRKIYNNYEFFVEVEKFEDSFNFDNEYLSVRKIDFYEKLGFKKLDFELELLGRKYSPYVLNCIDCSKIIYDKNVIIQNIFDIYYNLLGERMIKSNCKVLC